MDHNPIEVKLELSPDDFDVECARYRTDPQYRASIRRRAGVFHYSKRAMALEDCESVIEQEWRLMCRGGQFSPARFRAAAVVLIEEPKRQNAGMSW